MVIISVGALTFSAQMVMPIDSSHLLHFQVSFHFPSMTLQNVDQPSASTGIWSTPKDISAPARQTTIFQTEIFQHTLQHQTVQSIQEILTSTQQHRGTRRLAVACLSRPGRVPSCRRMSLRTWTCAVLPSHVSLDLEARRLAVACLPGPGRAPSCRRMSLRTWMRVVLPSHVSLDLDARHLAVACLACPWTRAVLPSHVSPNLDARRLAVACLACPWMRAVLPSRRLAGPGREVSPSHFPASSWCLAYVLPHPLIL
jgi:hypothetical protein